MLRNSQGGNFTVQAIKELCMYIMRSQMLLWLPNLCVVRYRHVYSDGLMGSGHLMCH
jgi:hypothetical protein